MQLPSVQLDQVAEDAADVFIANRNPQPGEVQIPTSAAIEFDVFGDVTGLKLTVGTEVVYDAGGYRNDWTGTIQPGVPDSVTTRYSFVSPVPYDSGQRVLVRAFQGTRFATWTFHAYDTTAPLLEAAAAVNKDQIKVTFSEPVYMGAVELGDALNPTSYYIERVSRPAVSANVIHVDYVSETEVLLTTDIELSFGAQYMLVVTGIEDEFDNVFVAPDNVIEFNGWLPPYPANRRWLLHDFVPRFSLAEDTAQDLVLFLGCLQDTNNLLLYFIDKWIEIIDPDTAPEEFVDAMLLDFGNPFDFDLTLTQKRKLAKTLMRIYRLKGTAKGIIDVVRFFLGIEVTIETFTGNGWRIGYDKLSTKARRAVPNPAIIGPGNHAIYSFRVLTNRILTAEQAEQIRTIATYMKGAQEHLIGIRDGSADSSVYRYWVVGKTKIGYVMIFGDASVVPSSSNQVTSFVLSS